MSEFYTNVAIHKNDILVCGYLDGVRYTNKIKYKPYLFVSSNKKKGDYRNLRGNFVERMDFTSIHAARQFYNDYSEIEGFQLYGLNQFVYTYIYDNFSNEIKYDNQKIQVHNLDIETGKTETGQFADVVLANGPITLIGIGIKEERIVFGYKENYKSKSKHVRFLKCKNEVDMLQKFILFWSHPDYRPDVVTGWNCERYDIPMIVNRIKKLLGEDEAKKLSPWGILKEKTVEIRGKEFQVYEPLGITILDYYDLYRKFTYNQQESYTLDHIAFVETGKRKLDYSEYSSLDELYEKNFEKYVDYNIGDIDRVADIDAKNKFIDLVYAMAFDAKVNFIDALTSVRLWDVIIHNHLMDKGIVIPKDMRSSSMNIPGGYVKEPQIGMHDWVVSFDLQSLYPHLIMNYNISPETLIDITPWIEKNIQNVIDGNFDNKELKKNNLCQAANGARFARDRQGFFPELMKIQFQKRREYQGKLKELRKQDPKHPEIQKYHNYQLAKKIQLNSAYGALANDYCRYFDWRLASAITLSGQLAIRWIEKKVNNFLNYSFGTKDVDYVIAMDTDSVYLRLKDFVNIQFGDYKETDKKEIIDWLDVFCEKQIQPIITAGYKELADVMNSYENAMSMKREAIADKALWKQKKHYIMNVWDNEGVRYDKPELKIMGIEVAKSIIPQTCRTALKETIWLIMNKNEDDVKKYIADFRGKFDELNFENISFPRGVNNLTKYTDPVTIWKKASPVHVKAALVYNKLLKDKNLLNKYPQIYDRDKLKFCYLKTPNPSQSPVIGALRSLPEEFDLERFIDRDLMFEKTFLGPIQAILNTIGWKHKTINSLETFFQ